MTGMFTRQQNIERADALRESERRNRRLAAQAPNSIERIRYLDLAVDDQVAAEEIEAGIQALDRAEGRGQ